MCSAGKNVRRIALRAGCGRAAVIGRNCLLSCLHRVLWRGWLSGSVLRDQLFRKSRTKGQRNQLSRRPTQRGTCTQIIDFPPPPFGKAAQQPHLTDQFSALPSSRVTALFDGGASADNSPAAVAACCKLSRCCQQFRFETFGGLRLIVDLALACSPRFRSATHTSILESVALMPG